MRWHVAAAIRDFQHNFNLFSMLKSRQNNANVHNWVQSWAYQAAEVLWQVLQLTNCCPAGRKRLRILTNKRINFTTSCEIIENRQLWAMKSERWWMLKCNKMKQIYDVGHSNSNLKKVKRKTRRKIMKIFWYRNFSRYRDDPFCWSERWVEGV
jgi:hypothetical protein